MRTWSRHSGRFADERGGSDVAALVVTVPLAFAAVLLFVFVGRQGRGAEAVTHAAAVAARAASMERSAAAGAGAAQRAAATTLAAAGTSCAGGPAVAVDADGWSPGGVIVVTVTCSIPGVAAIGASGRTLTGSARSTIDSFGASG